MLRCSHRLNPTIARKGKTMKHKTLKTILGAAFVAVVITVVAHPTTPASRSVAPHASPQAATVAYACTGSAPNGITITSGPEGTSDSALALPFHQSAPLAAAAEYATVTAQLQGAGHVTCTTTVTWAGQSVTRTASADGGYNLANAEVCSDFSGGWQDC
jgi:hypothetical protein